MTEAISDILCSKTHWQLVTMYESNDTRKLMPREAYENFRLLIERLRDKRSIVIWWVELLSSVWVLCLRTSSWVPLCVFSCFDHRPVCYFNHHLHPISELHDGVISFHYWVSFTTRSRNFFAIIHLGMSCQMIISDLHRIPSGRCMLCIYYRAC